jgi:hypothetical protein
MSRQNISGESPAQLGRTLRHMGNFGRRELAPEEIIRVVKERFRICNYLFRLWACWLVGALVVTVLPDAIGFNLVGDSQLVFVVLITVGAAIFACAMALTFALYRCPVCDKYLSRFRSDKFHCARCGAQVKESA